MPFSSFFISALSVLFLVGGIVSSFSVLHRESSVRRFSESLQAPEYLFSAGAPRLASDDVKGRGSSSVGHTKLYSTWLGEGSPFFPTVLGLPPGDARVARGVAKHLFRSSTMASTVTQRMALLCDASESLQQALRLEPEDPMTALAWIELEYLSLASRQQQPQFSCSSSLVDE
ncbi:hypothetical protein MRY87_09730, partial [bacterium]|nr:hypothetical protein [bacterium]